MNRTVRVILRPTPEQAPILAGTVRRFTQAFNLVCIAAKYRAVVGMPGDGRPNVNRPIVGEGWSHRSARKPSASTGGG